MLGVMISWIFIGIMLIVVYVLLQEQIETKETKKQMKVILVIGWILIGLILMLSTI